MTFFLPPWVIVRTALDLGWAQGQERRGPIQRLYLHPSKQRPLAGDPGLTLFVHAQHQGTVWRIEIQTDNVAHLFELPIT
jgi:hypothetical protein